MRRPLPPLNALRAFEATARHASFSKAAEELHVTPAALSHQIRGLEDLLGLKLFVRRARAIEQTEAARLIYPGIRNGFESLRAAVEQLDRAKQDRILVVSASPGLTAKWLVPRIYRFLARHPDVDTRISAGTAYSNFVTDGVDVGIRLSSGVHPELYVEKLSDEWMLPLCSPRLLEGEHPLRSPHDLPRFPLIQIDLPGLVPTWDDWLRAVGIEGIDTTRGLRLNVADHALDAASEGQAWCWATSWSPRTTSLWVAWSCPSGRSCRCPAAPTISSVRGGRSGVPPSRPSATGCSPRSPRPSPSCRPGRRAVATGREARRRGGPLLPARRGSAKKRRA